MYLTQHTDYGLRVLVYTAINDDTLVNIGTIAETYNIFWSAYAAKAAVCAWQTILKTSISVQWYAILSRCRSSNAWATTTNASSPLPAD